MADNTIDKNAFYKFTYGLFVITAKDGEKDNGCIINTAQQVTTEPNRISVAVNKHNYTHDMIGKTKEFNVSILSEDTTFSTFQQFGFQTGREVDKFEGMAIERMANGIAYIREGANAVISAKVVEQVDLGTHTLFIGDVTESITCSKVNSVTYAYYFANIKPKPAQSTETKGKVWICTICNYEYSEEKEGVAWEDLPADWVCPLCKHPKSDFVLKQ